MITGTYIAETIDRAFDGLETMLGIHKTTPDVNEARKSGKNPKKKKTKKTK